MVESKIENGLVRSSTTTEQIKTKKDKVNLKYLRDKDREPVKGIFHYYEVPGGMLEFCFRAYKEDPIEQFRLYDGQVYTLPYGVAKHLNNNGKYPQYEYLNSEKGVLAGFGPDSPIMKIKSYKKRYGFQSLEFTDIEGLNNSTEIVEVSTYHKALPDIGKVIF